MSPNIDQLLIIHEQRQVEFDRWVLSSSRSWSHSPGHPGPPSGTPPLADLGSRTEELGNLPQVTQQEATELAASLLAFQWLP